MYRVQGYEPGTVESTGFQVDLEGTRVAYRQFAREREERIQEETKHLRAAGYCGVISDIAAVPIAAATRAGIPAVAVSNFTWDWILEPILSGVPGVEGIPATLKDDYRGADLYLRLPFHPREHPFRAVEDLPLVGRRATLPRAEVRRRLGLSPDPGRPVILLAIGGLPARGWPVISVDALAGIELVTVGELQIELPAGRVIRLPRGLLREVSFADLVAASDLVLTKPGYGICSECAANGIPLLGVERQGFAESPCLVEGMRRLVPFRELPLEEFLAGRWERPVNDLLAQPKPTATPSGGAVVAARRIGEILGLKQPPGPP